MRRVRGMIGQPVVCGGRRIGRLLQAELSEDLTRLRGIWVDAGLRGMRFIPSERLEMLGQNAVITEDAGQRGRMRARSLFRRAVSTDGERLGAVTGAEIDELTFAVTALELCEGVWDDPIGARRRILRFTVNPAGEVIVDDLAQETVERMVEEHEERHDEGPADGDADRRIGSHDLRCDELADGASAERQGQADRQLDRQQGRGPDPKAVR